MQVTLSKKKQKPNPFDRNGEVKVMKKMREVQFKQMTFASDARTTVLDYFLHPRWDWQTILYWS